MREARFIIILLAGVALFDVFSLGQDIGDKSVNGEKMDRMELNTQAFRCVIGNNSSAPSGHQAGYNGLWSLIPHGMEDNLIAEGLAGLNLEHYINGWDEVRRSRNFFLIRVIHPWSSGGNPIRAALFTSRRPSILAWRVGPNSR